MLRKLKEVSSTPGNTISLLLCCRGSGQFGQLGLGSQNDESLPHLVKEIENEKCTYVTAGANSIHIYP